ncbi:MAG: ComF family protein [Chloroflexi bacterium]|nr:ComF family protein [Chloroflexota bacterium]
MILNELWSLRSEALRASAGDWARPILDLLFPPRCFGCSTRGAWLCADCVPQLPHVEHPICQICGYPTAGTKVCAFCYKTRPKIHGIRAPYYFEGALRDAIHRFKYKHAKYLAEPLAHLLLNYLQASPIDADIVVPVPLHQTRLAERGYNQSELLAIELGKALNLPVVARCVDRIRPTDSQMSLPAQRRIANVRGAFYSVDKTIAGKKVLLIDDVCTTGATLESCTVALQRVGVSSIWGLCIARARFYLR